MNDALTEAKRIMGRLAQMPHKPHKPLKASPKSRRRRKPKAKSTT